MKGNCVAVQIGNCVLYHLLFLLSLSSLGRITPFATEILIMSSVGGFLSGFF